MKTIPIENYEALKRINESEERKLSEARKEIEKLKGQIELLKKLSLLGDLFKYEQIRNLCNER